MKNSTIKSTGVKSGLKNKKLVSATRANSLWLIRVKFHSRDDAVINAGGFKNLRSAKKAARQLLMDNPHLGRGAALVKTITHLSEGEVQWFHDHDYRSVGLAKRTVLRRDNARRRAKLAAAEATS